jgi:hypothetical protein
MRSLDRIRDQLPRLRVPHEHTRRMSPISLRACCDQFSIRRKSDMSKIFLRTQWLTDGLARLCVPDNNRMVCRRSEPGSVSIECNADETFPGHDRLADWLMRLCVPEKDAVIPPCRNHRPAIGTEDSFRRPIRMSPQKCLHIWQSLNRRQQCAFRFNRVRDAPRLDAQQHSQRAVICMRRRLRSQCPRCCRLLALMRDIHTRRSCNSKNSDEPPDYPRSSQRPAMQSNILAVEIILRPAQQRSGNIEQRSPISRIRVRILPVCLRCAKIRIQRLVRKDTLQR